MPTSSLRGGRRTSSPCIVAPFAALALCVSNAALAHTKTVHFVDGFWAGSEYQALRAMQQCGTGFGNNVSELNALLADRLPNGQLQFLLTGNIESNGNTIVVLLDVKPGGCVDSTLRGGFGVIGSIGGQKCDDWGTDVDGEITEWPTPAGGSILNPGFDPDYAIEISGGFCEYFTNIIDLTLPNEPNPDRDVYLGQNFMVECGGTIAPWLYPPLTADVSSAFANFNIDGINGEGDDPLGDPLSAITGIEMRLGSQFFPPGATVKMMAFITSGGGDYLSNQFLPPLPTGTSNLGLANELGAGDPLFDARNYANPMFVTIDRLPCAGNTNNDAAVNVTDLLAVISAWGACVDCPNTPCAADIAPPDAGDCVVNVTDLLGVISAWGACP